MTSEEDSINWDDKQGVKKKEQRKMMLACQPMTRTGVR